MKNFYPPREETPIPLLCLECKKMFVGPCPRVGKVFDFFPKPAKKTVCPNCGSKKVVPHPAVRF